MSELTTNQQQKNRKYSKVMLLMAIVTTLSKIFGFARDIILTNAYGAGAVADAYLATLSIPDMVLDLLAHAVMLGFVPIAVEKLRNSKEELNVFATSAMKMLLILALFFTSIMAIFPDVIVGFLAPGFTGESLGYAVVFLRVLSFTIIFRSVTSIFQAYLSTSKCFLPSAFLGVVLDISVIVFIIASKQFSYAWLLPFGALVGALCQTLLLLPFSLKHGFKVKLKAKILTQDIKQLLIISIPAFLSIGLMQISALVNRALASNIMEGGITMLNQATKISFFVENIIVYSIATVLYPLLTEHYINNEKKQLQYVIGDAVDKLVTFLLPVMAGLMLLSLPIIDILYGHGEFTSENVKITAELMSYNVIGIVGLGVQTLLTRSLFSMKKVKTSIIMSLSLLATYITCSVVFSAIWGLKGIALATGVSYTIGALAYYIVVYKICGGVNSKQTLITLLKASACTLAMAIPVYFINQYLVAPAIVVAVVCVAVGVVVYFAMAQLVKLKHATLREFIKMFKRKKR